MLAKLLNDEKFWQYSMDLAYRLNNWNIVIEILFHINRVS